MPTFASVWCQLKILEPPHCKPFTGLLIVKHSPAQRLHILPSQMGEKLVWLFSLHFLFSISMYSRGIGSTVECTEPGARIFKLLRNPRIDSKEPIPPSCVARAGIFKKSMGARHRGGIGFSYRPARLHRLLEFIPWNQCRGPITI